MTISAVVALLWPLIAVQNPEVDQEPTPSIEFETPPSLSPAAAPSEFAQWSVGFGVDIWTGFGSVFNDMGGPSLNAGYRINERWGVGLRLFKSDFDFEDPADFVFGRSGTPIADASIDLLSVTASARWHFLEPGGTFDFYVGGGVGFAFPDSGEAVNLPQVDISVEGKPGPEVHIAVGGAVRVFEQFRLTLELRMMKSFTEYEVEDRQNGQEETEEGFSGIGFAIGAEYRF
jgi:outer membrane protein W